MLSGQLNGWRYRSCGSWDVYAAVLGEKRVSTPWASKKRKDESGMPSRTYGKDARCQNMDVLSFKESKRVGVSRVKATGGGKRGLTQSKRVGVSSSCANQF